ncbi:E3 ubiquitin-protein ligase RNF4 isoform X1 [Chiroxiphia lanceolata]|uniref:E3 ubiquitin-protein ligase RNF4 isoform X1 n=2 Tax=Chiroxiphia lanceolata TaxID=296741 RepID=UPI0013CE40ED|nr:E3 ubiquitin-protein ligase RNF4 isoform X1 [Chiroxiphia lanceolata]
MFLFCLSAPPLHFDYRMWKDSTVFVFLSLYLIFVTVESKLCPFRKTCAGLEEHRSLTLKDLDFLSVTYLKESKELIVLASLPLLFCCVYLLIGGFRSRNTMSTTQRKRRGGAVNSRQARKRNRLTASTAEMASEAEPIELEESAGEEVVDLTCESSEPVVVDLTHNDSVVIVEENQRQRRNLRLRSQRQSDSCVLSSDDEDETRDNDVYVTEKVSRELGPLEEETESTKPSGTVSCPICMDVYSEIVQSGRLIVSTKCGHVFCSQCLRDSLRNANSCPTCRKKLTHRQYHPIYI